jgi:hypothetical protein
MDEQQQSRIPTWFTADLSLRAIGIVLIAFGVWLVNPSASF